MDNEEEGPEPGDTEAWRRLIEKQTLGSLQGRTLVAAVQAIGPFGDRRVVEPLMKEISARIMRILRKRIGRNHRNEGYDLIESAHGQLIEAVLQPDSADGSAMRTAFVATIKYRAADAIRAEQLHAGRYDYALEEDALPRRHNTVAPDAEERAHVESVLSKIQDERKRLAFRLHLDGVPRNSKRVESIATALGVSAKTAETWIREIEDEIKAIVEVRL